MGGKLNIIVAGTFPPEAIGRALARELVNASIPCTVNAQWSEDVVHQLAEPHGKLAQNDEGINVVLVRPDDWNNFDVGTHPSEAIRSLHERRALDMSSRLEFLAHTSGAHFIVCICPYARNVDPSAGESVLRHVEEIIASELQRIREIKIVKLEGGNIQNVGTEGDDGYLQYAPAIIDLIAKQLLSSIKGIIQAGSESWNHPVGK